MKYIANKTNIPFQPFSPGQILLQLREEFRFEARILAIWSAILCAVLSGCTLAMISAPHQIASQRATDAMTISVIQ